MINKTGEQKNAFKLHDFVLNFAFFPHELLDFFTQASKNKTSNKNLSEIITHKQMQLLMMDRNSFVSRGQKSLDTAIKKTGGYHGGLVLWSQTLWLCKQMFNCVNAYQTYLTNIFLLNIQ